MLEIFKKNAREIQNSVDNSGVAKIIRYKTIGGHKINIGTPTINMGNAKISDNDLKYTPKSEFINNAEVLSSDEVAEMSDVAKDEFINKLQGENLEVRKENEQFRQQNFILIYKVRKMEKMGAN
jgi:hypothetical protein